jgi:hypothetical protein
VSLGNFIFELKSLAARKATIAAAVSTIRTKHSIIILMKSAVSSIQSLLSSNKRTRCQRQQQQQQIQPYDNNEKRIKVAAERELVNDENLSDKNHSNAMNNNNDTPAEEQGNYYQGQLNRLDRSLRAEDIVIGHQYLIIWTKKQWPIESGLVHCIYPGKVIKIIQPNKQNDNTMRYKIQWTREKCSDWVTELENILLDNEINTEILLELEDAVLDHREQLKERKERTINTDTVEFRRNLINMIYETQLELDNGAWEQRAIFNSKGLTKAKINDLLDKDREISTVHSYSFEKWREVLSTNPVAALFEKLPIEVLCFDSINARGRKLFKTLNTEQHLTQRTYTFGPSTRRIHTYVDEDFNSLNLLCHDNRGGLDNELSHLSSYKTNIFYGSRSTQVGLHIDATGGIGHILNRNGRKLFLFADYAEVQAKYWDIFTDQRLLKIDRFNSLQSFRWVLLQPGQYLYWPGYSYHAVFNIENSVFISPTYLPAIQSTAIQWLNYILRGNHKFKGIQSLKALHLVLRNNFNNSLVRTELTQQGIQHLTDLLLASPAFCNNKTSNMNKAKSSEVMMDSAVM